MVLAVVICGAAIFWINNPKSLAVISCGSGLLLVLMLGVLDFTVAQISNHLLCEVESRVPDRPRVLAKEKKQYQELLAKCRARYLNDRDVVLKLDLPILIGVFSAWVLGYLLLPQFVNVPENAYAYGFATGATALQIIIGNVTFEIMIACSST